MMSSRWGYFAVCLIAVLSTGCAQYKAPPYAANYESLDRLKASKPSGVAVGTIQPTTADHHVNNLSLRGARLVSASGTFSKYLEDALIGDFKEISAYDSSSKTRLDATILNNEVSIGGFVTGTGFIKINLVVARDGQQRLSKTYQSNTSFDSSFAGNVAIPAGQAAYTNLVRTLLSNVYSDPQFIAALGK